MGTFDILVDSAIECKFHHFDALIQITRELYITFKTT